VKVEAAKDASGFRRFEGLIQGARVVGAQVVEHDSNDGFVGVVTVDKVSHARGEIEIRPALCDLHMAPGKIVEKTRTPIGAVA
jgi:hypothetical protein